jgi:predicted regulator of Ras-like GTPase activity (Roadblock/LC7/MglB family)
MMKRILESLHSVEGVQGSLVVDGTGQILAYQAHAVYDVSLLEQVSQTIVGTVDAVRLLHEDWDSLSASFSEGNLILRNLKPGGAAAGTTVVLGLIADNRLNASFAGVAIRVATAKLKSLLESPNANATSGIAHTVSTISAGGPPSGTLPPPLGRSNPGIVNAPAPDLGSSGVSWSGLGSSLGASSEIAVADPRTSAFLTACTKALASCIGPMAKIFVKEGVRQLCPDRPFSRAQGDALISLLRAHIEDPTESAEFQKKMRAFA